MPLGDDREALTHFELHRAIQNVIERTKEFPTIHFAKSEPEYGIRGAGFADLVVFDQDRFPWLTIETKATTKAGDPFNPKVINQALGYASALGSSYFATCDGRTFVLFDNKERGVPFWERKRFPPYDLAGRSLDSFAETLLRDIIRLEDGESKWSTLDEAFVWRLKFLHDRFVPYLSRSLHRHVESDPGFKSRFESWLEEKGAEPGAESDHKTAVEAAYILINRILFYKVLEAQYADVLPKLSRFANPSELSGALEGIFKRVTDEIDYEAVYEHGLYSEIPLPSQLAEIVNEFLDEAASYDLSAIQSDVLGRIYEGLIPPRERKDLGQYYTPPPICDLLVRMCVSGPEQTILDPSCGSGGFLIKGYYQLLRLSGVSTADAETHKRILGQLYGVDISQFPAHLSVINLALRDITAHLRASEVINVYPLDFFKVQPRQSRLTPHPTVSLQRGAAAGRLIPMVDAIVCNPPYTRQDDIGSDEYREAVRGVA
jgi:type I restriction enzyme M protein